jgi:hypothetical protein
MDTPIDKVTLKQLVIQMIMVQNFLEEKFNISFENEQYRLLTPEAQDILNEE